MPRPPAHATPKPPTPLGPGRPKDMTKRIAILDAARQMFTRHDFVNASMDQIAACAGVSKLTVYNHFGDKGTLFATVVREWCEQSLPTALFQPAPETPLHDALLDIAHSYFALISSEDALSGHRMMCSHRLKHSSLSRSFWEAGPMRVQSALANLLQRRQHDGELDMPNPATAAAQFFALLRGMPYEQLVFDCETPETPADIPTHLRDSVDMFLRAYGTPCSTPSPL